LLVILVASELYHLKVVDTAPHPSSATPTPLPDNILQVAPLFLVNLDVLQYLCPHDLFLVVDFIDLIRISILFSLEPLKYQLRIGVEMEIADADCNIKFLSFSKTL